MSATINPRQLNLESRSHSYRCASPYPDPSGDSMDAVMDDTSLSSLPGRRTRAARAHANNKLLRIDTEQLKSLSLRERGTARHLKRSSTGQHVREQQFQKYREFLWETGRANLGNKDAPHVNIAPVRLPTTQVSSYGSITIYTVVHSQGHSPVGLRRKFDRNLLSATVLEPFKSPSTPNFNREELLSSIVDANQALASRRPRKSTKTTSAKTPTRMREEFIPTGIPMPAIIMSNQVRVGDTIELPLPQPEAWAETVAWVYTGEEELMTDKVRENVQYLGGRVP
ncbi:hypothetical protein LEL_00771 [Akanthomyces lecanii RCEF 1005]|uniref:Uncharacterized protein n=1 Tax=Akanthomyces lecanii RCEF 1005 TaxID=1081108 RepID=A0A162KMG3_CORDF|nr:hypothetical protein LEL_00771 [Akanthomyces lecanii RCEF 1005]